MPLVHIYGGTWDAASGTLLDPGVRHVVYLKNGSIYRVTLDKGGQVPSAVQLSSESQAVGSLVFVAQSRDGSDALFRYTGRSGGGTVPRFVSLRTAASDSPMPAPTFPGDLVFGSPSGWTLDPATGAIDTVLWSNDTSGGRRRLFRTDASLGNVTSVATFADLNMGSPWVGDAALNGGRMARGRFFIADGALRRYDDATGAIQLVFPDVTSPFGSGICDDTHVYIRLQTSAGPRLVRAPDTADSTGVAISSSARAGCANLNTA